MNPKPRKRVGLVAVPVLTALALFLLAGCSGRELTELEPATAPVNPVVFADAFTDGLDYSAFEFSYYEALSIDQVETYAGTHSLKITIPAGNWAGGSFWSQGPRDLSGFNALTFYAKADQDLVLDAAGFGIGIVSPADNQAQIANIALGTAWRQIVIPIPDPGVMANERGLFWFSDGGGGAPVQIWFDEVRFARLPGITNVRPTMASSAIEALQGEAVPLPDGVTTFDVDGQDVAVAHTPAHFNYLSSDESVVRGGQGTAVAVGGGTATVTARLGDVDVDGEIQVTVIGPPAEAAPVPTHPAGEVISLFSDAYDGITVDTWRTTWSSGSVEVYDQDIAGDHVKAYIGLTNLAYVGAEFIAEQIDAATPGMTHFHLDVYAPSGSVFAVKLVDFGPDGAFGGGDDTEKGLSFSSVSNPPFVPGEWVSLDIPLTSFTGMRFSNVAQLILQSPNVGNVWVDNIYFHK